MSTQSIKAPALANGIRSRHLNNINGLDVHLLEAGFQSPDRPCVLLLHGFPELAYSFRNIMLPLAAEGYHVIAPDQRGFGRTTGWNSGYDGDISQFGMINLVRDIVALLGRLGHQRVDMVVGHDFGSMVAGCCTLFRPDIFQSLTMMSAPFAGIPSPNQKITTDDSGAQREPEDIHQALAKLDPPRKHYQWYYCDRSANEDMLHCSQGLREFLRAYFHFKSADWKQNEPQPLAAWKATELARMPRYYVMDQHCTMAETVAVEMPDPQTVADCVWLSEDELDFYVREFDRTGFQGGLNWYRCRIEQPYVNELSLLAGCRIEVPAGFIAGARDWGIYQKPGDIDTMQHTLCRQWLGTRLIDGAGHWVQQEQPHAVSTTLLEFLKTAR